MYKVKKAFFDLEDEKKIKYYFPDLYEKKSKREIKSLNKEFYKKLKFELFREKLVLFLKLIKKQTKKTIES